MPPLNNPGSTKSQGQIDALTGLRGFAALWVVCLHFGGDFAALIPAIGWTTWFTVHGFYAVAMFFILSGFILLHTYRDRFPVFTWHEYRRFLGLRLARIYPGYLAALAAMVILVVAASLTGTPHNDHAYPLAWLLPEALMLHAWTPIHFAGWNFPDWSVSAEWFAYLFIFPVAIWLLNAIARSGKWMVSALLLGVLLLEPAIRTEWEISMVSLLFLAGALLWELRRRILADQRPLPPHLDSIGFLGLLVVCWFTSELPHFLFSPLCLFAIALLIFGLSRPAGWISRLFATRVWVFLGEISYSIYLMHGVVQRLLKILLPASKYTAASLPVRAGVLTVYVVAILMAAVVLYFAVEHPARLWLRRKFSGAQTQR